LRVAWRSTWRKTIWFCWTLVSGVTACFVTFKCAAHKLATNLLNRANISRDDWVRLAGDCTAEGRFQPGLCHRRWEIETTYRELKVEQGMNGNLRGRTPECIQYEVAGHVVLYLLVRWLMVEAAVKHAIDPLRLSFKNALRELFAMHSSLGSQKAENKIVEERLVPLGRAGWGRLAGWWRRLRAGERPALHLRFDPERCAPTHGTTIIFGTEPGNATND
jgi:hypothetical protein